MPDLALSLHDVRGGYGNLPVLWGIDLSVQEAKTTVILGANGAGKTTLLKVVMGLLPATSGSIEIFGKSVSHLRTDQRIPLGVAYMSELGIFPALTVEENLRLGAYGVKGGEIFGRLENVYDIFTELRGRRKSIAGSLSGGQRKMVGVAKSLMSQPRLLIMDEPSSGLSPLYVKEVVERLKVIAKQGMTLLIAEQNISFLAMADRVCVIEGGRVQFEGSESEFEADEKLKDAFFGLSDSSGH